MAVSLTVEQARRIAVRAQLLDAPRPDDLLSVVDLLTFVQRDPTAAIAPSADLVLWSRLGASYDPSQLTAALERDFTLFELNSLVRPMADLALFRAQFAVAPAYERAQRWLDDNDSFRDDVLTLLEDEGPLPATEIADTSIVSWQSSGWNRSRNTMMMLELLAETGRVAVAGRRGRDRLWDLAERVYHSDIPTVPLAEALAIRDQRRLRSQGVVPLSTPDLPLETTRIGAAGVDAEIEGLPGRWRVDPHAVHEPFTPRTALLSPFDGLIRDRKRMAQLFGFDYALEMYKPAAARRWGYYALPILHGDRLVGKVDASADRGSGRLVVSAVHRDRPFDTELEDAVEAELLSLAGWLGLRAVLPPRRAGGNQ